MIRRLRRLHTFLGVFFSLLLFVITGWWQTVSPNRNKGLGFGTSWIEKLSTLAIIRLTSSKFWSLSWPLA